MTIPNDLRALASDLVTLADTMAQEDAATAARIADLEAKLAAATSAPPTPAPAPTPAPVVTRLGVYRPWFPTDLGPFVTATGKTPTLAMQYADYRGGYDQISNPWNLSAWADWLKADANRRFLYSVPLLTNADKGKYTSTAADAAHKALAQRIVSLGVDGQVILRLGWECNGTWYPWSTNRDGFKAMFRRLVGIYRSVSSKFRFAWNVSGGTYDYAGSQDISLWYPGDDVVDYPTIDQYDQWWQHVGGDPAARWNAILPNLQQFTDFCAKHGKPGAFDEWGLVSLGQTQLGGGGDNPLYITNMLAWAKTHGFAWQCYFEDTSGGIYLRLESGAPQSLAAYRAAFA